jgi:hypothetical protein
VLLLVALQIQQASGVLILELDSPWTALCCSSLELRPVSSLDKQLIVLRTDETPSLVVCKRFDDGGSIDQPLWGGALEDSRLWRFFGVDSPHSTLASAKIAVCKPVAYLAYNTGST